MNAAYITINQKYQIELMPSGNHYPMRRSEIDGEFYYFRKGRNGQVSYKSERGARKFIADYMVRMSETDEQLQIVEEPKIVEMLIVDDGETQEVGYIYEDVANEQEGYSIVEESQGVTIRDYQSGEVFHVYGSTMRPMSASCARIPDAVFVNGDRYLTTSGNEWYIYTFLVVPHELDDAIIASYELVKFYGPIVWKPVVQHDITSDCNCGQCQRDKASITSILERMVGSAIGAGFPRQ